MSLLGNVTLFLPLITSVVVFVFVFVFIFVFVSAKECDIVFTIDNYCSGVITSEEGTLVLKAYVEINLKTKTSPYKVAEPED